RELFRHRGQINVVRFSPDGRRLLSSSDDGTVRIWDVTSGKEVHELEHGERVLSAAWAPDSKRIVSGGTDRSLCVWDAAKGALRRRIHLDKHEPATLAFAPGGEHVLSGGRDRTARLYRVPR